MHPAKSYFIITAILVCLVAPFPAYAEKEEEKTADKEKIWDVDLNLFYSDSEGAIKPKITLDLGPMDWESDEHTGDMGSYYFMAGLKGKITHAWYQKLNNEPSWANLNTGLFWNLSEMKEADSLPQAEPVSTPQIYDYDYGSIGAKVHAQAETDDDGDNVNLVGGAQFVYIPPDTSDNVFMLPPSVLLGCDYVKPQGDEARERLDAEVSGFTRLWTAILWNWPFGEKLASDGDFIQYLSFQFHYRYFKEFDQPTAWQDQDFDEYDQFNYRLRYILPHTQRKKFYIRDIYVGYTSGRQIAHAEDDDRVIVGVTLQ